MLEMGTLMLENRGHSYLEYDFLHTTGDFPTAYPLPLQRRGWGRHRLRLPLGRSSLCQQTLEQTFQIFSYTEINHFAGRVNQICSYYHCLLRINQNFGRIDLDMPVHVVLDIPPEVEGGVQLPTRLDQWGAESAPAYRALIGLSFLWHEPGRAHAPKGGRWLRKTGIDPYDPLDDDDAIALAYPSSMKTNRRELARRAWTAL